MVRLGLVAALLVVQEAADDPTFKNWSRYKPGTKITLKTEEEAAGKKAEAEITLELKSVSEKEIVLSVTGFVVSGGTKIEYPAKEDKLGPKAKKAAVDPKAKIEEGDEEIETAGKKFKCHWVKSTTEKGWETTWTSDEAPGRIVKAQGEGQGRKWKRWLGTIDTK
jgi:hypothetical protein